MIYLDNAATSFPKPAECLRGALEFYLKQGASPGRGGYDLAVEAEDTVTQVRERLARFFGADEYHHVCFACNATDALNTLIQGLVEPGCHVVSSRLEHNSVLRPLHHLHRQGLIHIDLVPFDGQGFIDPAAVLRAIRPETRFVLLSHASNVLGTVQPVREIGAICRKRGVPLLLDAAQSAGQIPIRMKEWGVQGLAFTGHKSLLGPTGIGGLVLSPDLNPSPPGMEEQGWIPEASITHWSTPSGWRQARSTCWASSAWTPASILWRSTKIPMAMVAKWSCGKDFATAWRIWPGSRSIVPIPRDDHLPLLTCNVEGHRAGDVGAVLDGDFDIAVRTGLHCAPLVHEDLGMIGTGTVRFSLGVFTTEDDIVETLRAMTLIVGGVSPGF